MVETVSKLTQNAFGYTEDILKEIEGYHTKVFELEKQISHFGTLAKSLQDEANISI